MNDTTFQGDGKVTYVPVVVTERPAKQTNYDLLIRKSPEELAEFFMQEYDCEDSFTCPVPHPCPTSREASCKQCFLDWLRQEVSDAL